MITDQQLKDSEYILLNGILPEIKKGLEPTLYDMDVILSATRLQHLVKLRQVLTYFLRVDLGLEPEQIGYIINKSRVNYYYSFDLANWYLFSKKDIVCIDFLKTLRTINLKYLVNTY